MMKKLSAACYRAVKAVIRAFYPRMEVLGLEKLPEEPCIIVSNHAQMNGPIACELYFPGRRYTWCAAQMMHIKEVPGYAFEDFWSFKPRRVQWFYRLASYVIAPLSVLIFNNANTIAVRRDMRIMSTFRETVARLGEGANVVIFPEENRKHNNIIYGFQSGFISVAHMYYRKTGRQLCFVPMYIAPKLKRMVLGEPVRFQSGAPIEAEKERICTAMMDQITSLARALPRHTVIPYRNIPRRYYPCNLAEEVENKAEKKADEVSKA